MATSGQFTMGVKAVPPMPPRLVMVMQAPCMSSGRSLRARAFSAISARSTEMRTRFFWSTSRTTGTIRPRSVSTATPRWKYFL